MTMETRDLWYGTSGPPDADIVLIGEAWGSDEAQAKRPFVGTAGAELDRILAKAGLDRNRILLTNVRSERPHGNEMWRFFTPSINKPNRVGGLAPTTDTAKEVARLYRQLLSFPRKCVIPAGNYPLWATSNVTGAKKLTRSNNRIVPEDLRTWVPTGIGNQRGSMLYAEGHEGFFSPGMTRGAFSQIKLLPIYHPAAIMRDWPQREPTIHDLKTRVPLALKDDWRPKYSFMSPPTFLEASLTLQRLIRQLNYKKLWIAADIETINRNIMTCIGIAWSDHEAMSVPFIDVRGGEIVNYWTPDEEATLVGLLIRLLSHPNILLVGQNFIYDTQYIQRDWGVTCHVTHDTMLAQNVLFPGVPKSLDYLSSMYCKYHWYWKEDSKEWNIKGGLTQLLDYNCLDCVRTWEAAQSQILLIKHLGQEPQMAEKMAINGLCLRMMNRGVRIDQQHKARLRYDMQEALTRLQSELLQIVPQELVGSPGVRAKDKTPVYWFTSDTKTKELFYDIFGFKIVRDPKTGQPTTGKKALMQFKRWYPEFSGLINRLDTAGSVDNMVTVLNAPVESNGCMMCSYNPAGTETHRLSSSTNAFGRGMNLQNLTKGEEDE